MGGMSLSKIINPLGTTQGYSGSDAIKNLVDPGGAFGDHGVMDTPKVDTAVAQQSTSESATDRRKRLLKRDASSKGRKIDGILTTELENF